MASTTTRALGHSSVYRRPLHQSRSPGSPLPPPPLDDIISVSRPGVNCSENRF
ncbi:hypothetical protein J6590_005588 [Homalodisca vitripennis]|nr:hypothetical protein J6590_005588 [Homalodisca vitripennis]